MNKKIIVLIIAVVIIVTAVVGFWFMDSNKKTESSNNYNNGSNTNTTDQAKETSNDKKVAIIYFSATGTTEKVAGYIKDWTGGDLIEIVPKDEYTSADLNYNNNNSRSTKEQNDSNARPEIQNNINTDNYDVIFLGYPIWWGDTPKIILTFLDSHNLAGKIVIPFCTSGSTDIDGSLNTLKNYNKNVIWIDGKRFSSNVTQNEVTNWVNGLNY